jgi:hypothetical protein
MWRTDRHVVDAHFRQDCAIGKMEVMGHKVGDMFRRGGLDDLIGVRRSNAEQGGDPDTNSGSQ